MSQRYELQRDSKEEACSLDEMVRAYLCTYGIRVEIVFRNESVV